MINAIDPRDFTRITQQMAACIADSIAGYGVDCFAKPFNPSMSELLDCMGKFCKGKGTVTCPVDDPDCCKNLGWCAHSPAKAGPKWTGECTITWCIYSDAQKCGGDKCGDKAIPPIRETFLHELAHCCGIQHGILDNTELSSGGWTCNDVVACCLYHVVPDKWRRQDNKCRRTCDPIPKPPK